MSARELRPIRSARTPIHAAGTRSRLPDATSRRTFAWRRGQSPSARATLVELAWPWQIFSTSGLLFGFVSERPAKAIPSATSRSTRRSRPPNPAARAASSRNGTPRARAARLAVPRGTIASAPRCTRGLRAGRTVPSPPVAKTSRAPASSRLVSTNSGSQPPPRRPDGIASGIGSGRRPGVVDDERDRRHGGWLSPDHSGQQRPPPCQPVSQGSGRPGQRHLPTAGDLCVAARPGGGMLAWWP
jgi:hypothetical protein